MKRDQIIRKIQKEDQWDILVIGGGASGLGAALDGVSRGYSVLLVDQSDYGKGTSSKSTKLVHGGVRYLEQGNIRLVREALKERDYILENASHNARLQPFIIPFYQYYWGLFYYIGLKVYDLLAGSRRIGKTSWLGKNKVFEKLPNVRKGGLKGGILYYDGQFDDARLCIDLVRTIETHGGTCINYCKVIDLIKEDGKVTGAVLLDSYGHNRMEIRAKCVLNTTGVFVDDILRMDEKNRRSTVIPSRGSHIVLDKSFLNSDHAVMIPKTSDGRVLFAIPWNEKVIVGTTDIQTKEPTEEPEITREEVQFILENAQAYLDKKPTQKDILATFAGLRPLAAPEEGSEKTKEISRGHRIIHSPSGLLTMIGGKWTTFRKMGEDLIQKAIKIDLLPNKQSRSSILKIIDPQWNYILPHHYLNKTLSEVEIESLVNEEHALSVEDILARRTRLLFLDTARAHDEAPKILEKLKTILGQNTAWEAEQKKSIDRALKQFSYK